MKAFRFLKNNKKKQRGVALIFALGILGLMVVLGLTFASLSFTEQTISRGSSEQIAARIMAKSAVQRVVTLLENNPAITDPEKIVSGGDPNNSNHFDYLWKLITHHGDVPGAGEMKTFVEKRVKNGENSPYWQYVIAPDKDGNDEIVGRFAYIAYQPVGLLDPYIAAKNGDEASSPVDRYGMTMDEIDLKALTQDSQVGGQSLQEADIRALGQNNANNSVPSDISTPADLFARFSSGTQTNLALNPAYIPLRDKLSSAWFSVPRAPAQPDRFLYKNPSTSVDTFYHRFNLNRTPDEWKDLTLNNIVAKAPETDMVVYDETAEKKENAALAIPWFRKNDDITRQIAANFLAYFSPIPDSVKDSGFWSIDDKTATYTANMRTPYLNELAFKIKFNMLVMPPTIEGNENSSSYIKVYTVEITPEIDVYVELADLYSRSLSNISSLSFNMNVLNSLKATTPTSSMITCLNGDMVLANPAFKDFTFDITNPASSNINTGTTANVFPVFTQTIVADKPFIATIRVPMTREPDGTGGYGPAKCTAVNFSEPLKEFILDKMTVMMSAKINGKSAVIPIDLANISQKTELPVLGEKKGAFDFSALEPFKLDIDTSGNYDAAQENQERVVVVRYRAIDSAANLQPEHWVEAAPEIYTKVSEALVTLGYNNYAELKQKTLLSIDQTNPDYNKITVKINTAGETKEFLVDKETDHDNINAVTGYGAVVSTSYIRGKAAGTVKIQSPWEIGFIHRGLPYQTLNIKRYNPSATEIAEYENGDANIFDYLKIVQKESDNSVLDENKIHTRGLVNLKKVSRQNESGDNAGNLPAARAFFSNIDLGWKIDLSNDLFTIPASAGKWNDNLVFANTIVKELADVVDKADFILNSRAAILDPAHSKLHKVLTFDPELDSNYSVKTDAEKEEVIGRFIMLTTADTSKVSQFTDFLVVTAIAQRIQINTASQVPDKDWLRDGTFATPSFSGSPSSRAEESAWIEAGFGYRYVKNGVSGFWSFKNSQSNIHPSSGKLTDTHRKMHFYPGYDKILSTQKVIAWLRKNSSGKWYIERLDYVD